MSNIVFLTNQYNNVRPNNHLLSKELIFNDNKYICKIKI